MGTFTVEVGNIFNYATKVDYICNPTNSRGAMGAGLAYKFMKSRDHATNCIEYNAISVRFQKSEAFQKKLSIGVDEDGLHLIRPLMYGEPKSKKAVLFFATKINWKNPSEMKFIEAGFEALNEDESTEGMTFAMPLLGGGLGGLDPKEVEAKMKELTEQSRFNVILVKPQSFQQ